MVEWFRCSTRIHKILRSNRSILILRMTMVRSLTAKLSRMTHWYRASVSTLNGRGVDTAVRKRKKDGRNWLHVHIDPNNNRS